MINIDEYINIDKNVVVDGRIKKGIGEKLYKINLKKNKLYYIKIIPNNFKNMHIRLYNSKGDLKKIDKNINYNDYILLDNLNDIYFEDEYKQDEVEFINNEIKEENKLNLEDKNDLDVKDDEMEIIEEKEINTFDDFSYIQDMLDKYGLDESNVVYDEKDNTFYIDIDFTKDTKKKNKNKDYLVDLKNINNYDITLQVDGYENKSIYDLLGDIDKEVEECDKTVYYKTNKDEEIFISVRLDYYNKNDTKFKIFVKNVELIKNKDHKILNIKKELKLNVRSKHSVNKLKVLLKKDKVYKISYNNSEKFLMTIYNKKIMKEITNKDNYVFKVDNNGYYFIDIYPVNFKKKFEINLGLREIKDEKIKYELISN